MRVRYQNAMVIASSDVMAPMTTDWMCFVGQIAVQVTGSATEISIRVERSSLPPQGASGANPAPADDPGIEIAGNPSTGISPVIYIEPAVGWWRAVITSITGEATVTMTGHHGNSVALIPGTPL